MLPSCQGGYGGDMSTWVKKRALVVKPHNKTLYELFRGRTPALSFIKPFGCHVTIINTLDHLGKFDEKADETYFIGYSISSMAFKVYNTGIKRVEENLHIEFLENKPIVAGDGNVVNKDNEIDTHEKSANSINDVNTVWLSINTFSTDLDTGSLNIHTDSLTVSTASPEATHVDFLYDILEGDMSKTNTTYQVPSTLNTRIHKDHSLELVIGDVQSSVMARKITMTTQEQGFISTIYKEKTHEDLNTCKKAISTKWVFKNKKDEIDIVIKNKSRLVAHGYIQEEGIDYDEVFAPVSRIDAIRLFLAYASFIGFMVYQMVVKSAFLYGRIKEEVYVCQPLGFEDPNHPDKVHKVVKALYGLHQAPRVWYETIANYLLSNGFHRGKIDQTLFIKRQNKDILLVQVYADDIIFGSTKKELCNEFKRLMKDRFQMSSMGELTFFLGLQTASPPVEMEKPLVKDADGVDVDVHLYRSMIGSLMYLTASRPDIMYSIQALVDERKFVVNEASIRRDLRLDDAKGTTCLPNAAIFEDLARIGAKSTAWDEFSSTMASAIICLANNKKFNFSMYILENMVKKLEAGVKFLMFPRFFQVFINNQLGDMSHHKEIFINSSLAKKDATVTKKEISTVADEVVTTAKSVKGIIATTTPEISKDELTLAQTLMEIKVATPLSSKSPTIIDYKIYKEGKKSYFKIIRADGNSQNDLTFGKMFKNFNREDIEVLRSIVKERFKKTKPVNDMDNLLFQTLKTMSKHQLVLMEYKITTVFNKVNASKSRVTTADKVATVGWIKTEMA
uniref:Uncharacterized protein n=1 Tax=Tanacetum cinerariifolium TaxID=118510 RepID=A0A6L2KF05_TANCI|nr:hypothetical protein [Tanacetum cinerariifolium]